MRTWMALSLLALLCLTSGITGCGGGESYGEPMSDAEPVPIAHVLADPAAFTDEAVKIEGEIVRECPSGCWFELEDETGIIYVDIAPRGLAIPQKVGGTATVEGTVMRRDGRTTLIGSGVVIK